MINGSNMGIINITTDLEAISKLESGVLNLKYERFDIASLTRDIVDTIEFEATKKDISIDIGWHSQQPYPPVWVKADRYYIEQVLINLIINSIRYGNQGGHTYIKFIDLFDKILIEVRGPASSCRDCCSCPWGLPGIHCRSAPLPSCW